MLAPALRHLEANGFEPTVFADDGKSLIYLVSLLAPAPAQQIFEELAAWPDWKTETDDFGKQGRQSAYFGDIGCTFAYMGLTLRPHHWPPCLAAVKARADTVLGEVHGCSLTGCLANNYREGEGQIVYHGDEVRAHGEARLVVALSLGGERSMVLKELASGAETTVRLPSGSALVMGGATQEHWHHALPLDVAAAPHRISLTMRSIAPFYEERREAASRAAAAQISPFDDLLTTRLREDAGLLAPPQIKEFTTRVPDDYEQGPSSKPPGAPRAGGCSACSTPGPSLVPTPPASPRKEHGGSGFVAGASPTSAPRPGSPRKAEGEARNTANCDAAAAGSTIERHREPTRDPTGQATSQGFARE